MTFPGYTEYMHRYVQNADPRVTGQYNHVIYHILITVIGCWSTQCVPVLCSGIGLLDVCSRRYIVSRSAMCSGRTREELGFGHAYALPP